MRLGEPGAAALPPVGMARRSCAAGIASSASARTPATRNKAGCLRIMCTQRAPIVGVSCSGSGALIKGMRAANARVPHSPKIAGSKPIATSTAIATVPAAPSDMADMLGILIITSATSAMITVSPANTTAVPALPTARPARCARSFRGMLRRRCASSLGVRLWPSTYWISSLRKRDRINNA